MIPRIPQLGDPHLHRFVAGPNHYELLRVAPTASRQELRQAFRVLSKRYHPDTTELPAAEAEQAFRQLRQAYIVLSDPIARQRYDGELGQRSAPVAGATAVATTVPISRRSPISPDVRRALSGGEWLALLLLLLAVLFSLVLGVGLALLRGAELVQRPSWWSPDPSSGLVSEPSAVGVAEVPAAVDLSPPRQAPTLVAVAPLR